MSKSTYQSFALLSILTLTFAGGFQQPDEEGGQPLPPRLKTLERLLQSGTGANRVKAAKQIGELGEKAKPLTPALCKMATSRSKPISLAALDALRRVNPEFYEPVATLLTVDSVEKQLVAATALAELEEDLSATLPVVFKHIRGVLSNRRAKPADQESLLRADIRIISAVAKSHPKTRTQLAHVAGPKSRNKLLRRAALEGLCPVLESAPTFGKECVVAVKSALADDSLRMTGLLVAPLIGRTGAELLPTLEQLKKQKNPLLQRAANEAIEVINGDKKPDEAFTASKSLRVKSALRWLAAKQEKDGRWKTGMGSNGPAIVVTTSWCGLALMTAGKEYEPNVDRAANFVAKYLVNDPVPIKLPKGLDQSNWKVGIGGMFLCEYYAFKRKLQPRFKSKELDNLIPAIIAEARKRMEESGGWGHTARFANPLGYLELEIVSNWMLAMFGGASRLGFAVPKKDIAKAIEFIENCCNPNQGAVGYSPRRGQKGFGCPGRTGGAIYVFGLLDRTKTPLYQRMAAYWQRSRGESDEGHGSLAMGLIGSALGARQLGEKEWTWFQDRFFPKILKHHLPDGSFRHLEGESPKAIGGSDAKVGPAYNTGIYTLLLQLDSEHLRFLGKQH